MERNVVDSTRSYIGNWKKRFRASTFTLLEQHLKIERGWSQHRRCFKDARETIGEHVVPPITRHWCTTLQETGKKCRGSAASKPLKLGREGNTSVRENVKARVSACKAGLSCSITYIYG